MEGASAYEAERARAVVDEMHSSLSQYFIKTSVNTVAVGAGKVGVDGIAKALKAGYRALDFEVRNDSPKKKIEVSCIGTDKRLAFDKCMKAVEKHAFAASPYPLILCVRNLCDDEGSALMAEQLEAALKGKLYAPGERPQKLPSPEALRNLVLLYCDPKLDASGAAAVPAALNRVIAITQLNLPTLGAWAAAPHAGCADLTESVSPELGNKREMLAFTSANVARVLPNQGRVDANTNGSSAWYNGCQLYGINAHVPDLGRWLSDTKFSANGGCGYVRRPGWQSGEGLAPDRMDSSQKKYLKVQALHAKAAKKGQLGITMLLSGVGASDTLKTTQRYADTKDAKLKESAWIIPIAAVNLGMALFVLKDYSQPSAEADGGTTLGYTGITIGSLVVGTFKFPLVKPDGGATKHVLTISLGWQ